MEILQNCQIDMYSLYQGSRKPVTAASNRTGDINLEAGGNPTPPVVTCTDSTNELAGLFAAPPPLLDNLIPASQSYSGFVTPSRTQFSDSGYGSNTNRAGPSRPHDFHSRSGSFGSGVGSRDIDDARLLGLAQPSDLDNFEMDFDSVIFQGGFGQPEDSKAS